MASQPDAQATQAVASAPWSPVRALAQHATSVQRGHAGQENPVTPETTGQSLKTGPEGLASVGKSAGGAYRDIPAAGAHIDDTQISQPVLGSELLLPTMAVASISGGGEELPGSQTEGHPSEAEGALNGGTVRIDGSDDTDGDVSADEGNDEMAVDAEAEEMGGAETHERANIKQAAPNGHQSPFSAKEKEDDDDEEVEEVEVEGNDENADDVSDTDSDE